MSLEARTVDDKPVIFGVFEGALYIHPKNNVLAGGKWERESFCKTLKELWENYLNGRIKNIRLADNEFAIWPDFAGITEYYLSEGHSVTHYTNPPEGVVSHPEQEEILYWLKSKLVKRQEPELQKVNKLLDATVHYVSKCRLNQR